MKRFIKKIRHGLAFFGDCVALVVNSVLLLTVYVIGVGLTSLFARCAGKNFLTLKIDPGSTTYWLEIPRKKETADQYYRQF